MIKYQEIANDIRKNILAGQYLSGVQLPLEKEMCAQYNVSRITIKKAVDELVKLGLVIKRRGAGTFVKSIDDEDAKDLSMARQFTGFTETNKGKTLRTEIIKFDVVHPDKEIAAKLQIATDDFVYDIIRVRFADGMPIVIEYTKMPINLIPGIKKDVLLKSIYFYIQHQLKLKIQSAHRSIRAISPNALEIEHLKVRDSFPLLEVEQIAFLDDGRAFEYSISHHRSDQIVFKSVSIRQ
ncbi:GntR family transcriptional regulator [Propionispira arboris]|uniref:GntR family transcriptional regulator n=1 Tax=Propionispira arboris TaxID=84035 RepID=A0A1H6YHD9_9FIRM|nr:MULTISPECIES: GntR family transcriptional regulator [Propionispira]SEJ40679.1 GntR family transcriptional regulator [Propionispira arboris]